MTTAWYSIALSNLASPSYVAVGTSDPTADVAVEVNLASGANPPTSRQVIEAIEAIIQYIESKGLESAAFANMPEP